ncbi:hypothetical protein [Phytopseudomonas punonensis]|uniref:Uncharacterized protein n=1 Tax=Phytopseudomonas punonensis TaxID=1220495 RepID=A0A1M7NTW3_9GAMM|nr:hypothetical protein [Pseudomonas punonensis]SHN07468.1 hypothetical protein SAMN05216288_0492 [Pseudomonas punonensis]
MDIQVCAVKGPLGTCWQVRLGKHQVSFRNEDEARQFVATLQVRVQAPHTLPGERRLAG